MTKGTLIRIAGPVIDVRFRANEVPPVNTLLYVLDGDRRVAAEVHAQMGAIVRCIALEATEGLSRGLPVENTGDPITIPVGPEMLGRAIDVLGRPIDGMEPPKTEQTMPIHRKAPSFMQQQPVAKVFETGIKVIDLLAPYARGGKIGLFQHQRRFVQARKRDVFDNAVRLDVAEQGDLVADILRQRAIASSDDDVRAHAGYLQFLDKVLDRL